MKPLLVDTSAWIDFFSRHPNPALAIHIEKGRHTKRLATTELVILEVTRGARDPTEFCELQAELSALMALPTADRHWVSAAKLGFLLGRKGLQPPSTDLLIATIAIDYDCQLLQRDKHFPQIACYAPLRLLP
ncbi:MAG: PIN domain-containing protein [Deltaproteobacteria bacterium]|nr:PIN domain-containing protein [Deltaproteobacteria bacterium]